MKEIKKLEDYFPDADYDLSDDQFRVLINGVSYPYEMTVSPEVPDDSCCRVKINDELYYFGQL